MLHFEGNDTKDEKMGPKALRKVYRRGKTLRDHKETEKDRNPSQNVKGQEKMGLLKDLLVKVVDYHESQTIETPYCS